MRLEGCQTIQEGPFETHIKASWKTGDSTTRILMRLWQHLGSTLKELGVSVDLITEAPKITESTRHDILNREA